MNYQKIKQYTIRMGILFIGLSIMTVGASTLMISAIGADSVLVFSDGIATIFGIKCGTAILYLNAFLLVIVLFVNKKRIHIGTIVVTLIIGPMINLVMSAGFIPEPTGLGMSIMMTLFACFVTSFGIAIYMFANVGLAPFEAVIVSIQEKINLRFSYVKMGCDALLFLLGWMMGGIIGVGSIMALLIFGPAIDLTFNLLKKTKLNRLVASDI